MGKRNKNQKKRKSGGGQSSASPTTNAAAAAHAQQDQPPTAHPSAHQRDRHNLHSYPPPFPHSPGLPLPKEGFLHNWTGCYQRSYATALDTSYEGFVTDGPDASNNGKTIFAHQKIRHALQTMVKANLFRTDVTQPFGLGTKCAKTYVTRCLLGDPGTTYKYLGLRMFSHCWNSDASIPDKSLGDALHTIGQLNGTLTERTESHLSDLDEKRKGRGVPQPTIKGRAKFDIALINRMETSPDLKAEPMTGKGRCTVSWHADSSLENYSTIGVYHTLFGDQQKTGKSDEEKGWSVALRVANDSEGPAAGRRGTDIGSSVATETPVIAASLPSGAAYYMLDDFNHHHQHAVLAPENASGGVRFSSTHRLLRLGHNVAYVIERCRSACAGFHKKGPKVWRSEQLLLTDTESEWIRQFYIQGYGHKANLWSYWKEPICSLLKYWGQLERRTKTVVDLLKFAAEERCDVVSNASASRAERKLRDKRKKAAQTVADIMGRGDSSEDENYVMYVPLAVLLEERATMRSLWAERSKDVVFSRMDYEYRPLAPPFKFESKEDAASNKAKGEQEEVGRSPLAGNSEDLKLLASKLRQWGLAYQSQNPSDLPEAPEEEIANKAEAQGKSQDDDNSKSLSWDGWNVKQFGLEMQKPWAGALLSGAKKIETRAYPLPPALIGKKILILESKPGKDGVSSLGNVIAEKDGIANHVHILGWAIFDKIIEYRKRETFEMDEKLHLVTSDSGYGWKEGKTKVIYGWSCKEMKLCSTAEEEVGALVRRMRSLYQIQRKRTEMAGSNSNQSGKKKKKRKKKNVGTSAGSQESGRSKKKKRRY